MSFYKAVKKELYQLKLFFTNHDKYIDNKTYGRQTRASYGEANKALRFFSIRRKPKAMGVLSCYLFVLGCLADLPDGYIPVVDNKSFYYPLLHKEDDKVEEPGAKIQSRCNAWNYYFRDVSDYSVDELLKSKNVLVSKGFVYGSGKGFFDNTLIDSSFIDRWYPLDERCMHLNDELRETFEDYFEKHFKGKRMLGTMIREGYIVLAEGRESSPELSAKNPNIHNHPVQLTMEEMRKGLQHYMDIWNCDYLFVVAETEYIIDCLESFFPGKVLYVERKRRKIKDLSLEEFTRSGESWRENYPTYERNVDYLKEIFCLSKCTSLYGSKCSGTVVAALWNRGQYEHIEIAQKGLY